MFQRERPVELAAVIVLQTCNLTAQQFRPHASRGGNKLQARSRGDQAFRGFGRGQYGPGIELAQHGRRVGDGTHGQTIGQRHAHLAAFSHGDTVHRGKILQSGLGHG